MTVNVKEDFDQQNYDNISKNQNQWKTIAVDRDILVDSQNTFPKSFVESQSRFGKY